MNLVEALRRRIPDIVVGVGDRQIETSMANKKQEARALNIVTSFPGSGRAGLIWKNTRSSRIEPGGGIQFERFWKQVCRHTPFIHGRACP
jgi:hypothetical protein